MADGAVGRAGARSHHIEPTDPGWIDLTVSNSGTGIPDEDLGRVFDRAFKSADSAGRGLGLTIARSLVGAHGGAIIAESQPGAGTTVRFNLPQVTDG
jgi:signal transduction histidine kinase